MVFGSSVPYAYKPSWIGRKHNLGTRNKTCVLPDLHGRQFSDRSWSLLCFFLYPQPPLPASRHAVQFNTLACPMLLRRALPFKTPATTCSCQLKPSPHKRNMDLNASTLQVSGSKFLLPICSCICLISLSLHMLIVSAICWQMSSISSTGGLSSWRTDLSAVFWASPPAHSNFDTVAALFQGSSAADTFLAFSLRRHICKHGCFCFITQPIIFLMVSWCVLNSSGVMSCSRSFFAGGCSESLASGFCISTWVNTGRTVAIFGDGVAAATAGWVGGMSSCCVRMTFDPVKTSGKASICTGLPPKRLANACRAVHLLCHEGPPCAGLQNWLGTVLQPIGSQHEVFIMAVTGLGPTTRLHHHQAYKSQQQNVTLLCIDLSICERRVHQHALVLFSVNLEESVEGVEQSWSSLTAQEEKQKKETGMRLSTCVGKREGLIKP